MTNAKTRRPSNGSSRSHGSNGGLPGGKLPPGPPLPMPISSPSGSRTHVSQFHNNHHSGVAPPPLQGHIPPPSHHSLPPTSQAAIENWHVYRAATSSTNAFANPGGVTPDDAYVDAPTPAEEAAYSPPGTPLHYSAIDTDDEDVRIAVTALGSMRASGSSSSVNLVPSTAGGHSTIGGHASSSHTHKSAGTIAAPSSSHAHGSAGTSSSRRISRNRAPSASSSGGHSIPSQSSGSRLRAGSQHSGSSGGKQIILGGPPSGISAGASSRSTILGNMPPPSGASSVSSSTSYVATSSSRVSSHFSSASTMSSALSTPMSTPATEHTYLSGSMLKTPSLLTADGPVPYRPLRAQASTGDIPFRGSVEKGKGKDSMGGITLPPPYHRNSNVPPSPRYSSFGSVSNALYSGPPPISGSRRRGQTTSIHRASPTSSASLSSSSLVSKNGVIIPGIRSEDTDMMPPPTAAASLTTQPGANSRSSISKAASMASLRLRKDGDANASLDVARSDVRRIGASDAFLQAKGSGLRSMLVEAGVTAGGLSAAMSNESMKSLKYCLHWLQYATVRIEHQITILRDTMVKLNHGELDMSSPAVQNLTMIKGDVVTTIKGVVDVIGKYAGIALPEQARRSVKAFVLSLPARWASVNRIQTPAITTDSSGNRRGSFGGSPASPSFGPGYAQGNEVVNAEGHPGARAMQIAATSQAANRIITLAVESLDILRNVSIVFGESLDRADVWVERLRAVGLRRKRFHEQQELDEAESAEAYMLQQQQQEWIAAQHQHQMDISGSSSGRGSASLRGFSPSPPPSGPSYTPNSMRHLAPSPSSYDGPYLDAHGYPVSHSPVRPGSGPAAHWESARGAAMAARASSPSAESAISMATTASSSKRRRTIGSANGMAPTNRHRASHSPGDGTGDQQGDVDSLRGSGAGSSASVGRPHRGAPNLSMTPTVRTPAGSDDEGGNISMPGPYNRTNGGHRGSISHAGRSNLSSPPHMHYYSSGSSNRTQQHPGAGDVSPPPGQGSANSSLFNFKAAGASSIVVPQPGGSSVMSGGSGRRSRGSVTGRHSATSGRASGPNTPASYTQPLHPE
ncbi:transcriptional regulator opi1 [Tilletia horrida]|uniref:Transcriptional regulator opi1 n=1 Tax=Tilletia horrida TaxID=155126 RepID=A0AAN6GNU8_9BASI|nr:transcriptional regulator opi1 [Tilletia horrida]KAK0565876.1 transcriptional regulator opi1 [Tilletia horrida]